MYALLRMLLSLFGVRPGSDFMGCVVTPKFRRTFKYGVTTVVITVIIVLLVGHPVEVIVAFAAAWLVDILDMALREPEGDAAHPTTQAVGRVELRELEGRAGHAAPQAGS